MLKGKIFRFVLVICACLLLTLPVLADTQSSVPLTKDQLMHDLARQGYQWSDLLSADILARKYNVSLKPLIDVKPVETSWQKVETALAKMNLTRQTVNDQEKLMNDSLLVFLSAKGFTADEISLLAFQAALYDKSFTDIANKAVQKITSNATQNIQSNPMQSSIQNTNTVISSNLYSLLSTDNSLATLNGSYTIDDPGIGYDIAKCSPYNPVVGNDSEKIDPLTGFLERSETDLVLPGRNGLDFSLTRVYKSEKSELQKIGVHYNSIAEEYMNCTYGCNYLDAVNHLGAGWMWDLPSIEGGQYVHIGGTTYQIDWNNLTTGLAGVNTKEFVLTQDTSPYRLQHKSGISYLFNSVGKLSQITNLFGDTITYNWVTKTDGKTYLDNVVDSFNRKITFTYDPTLVTVTVVADKPYVIKYYKTQLSSDISQLSSVEYPEGVILRYNYLQVTCPFTFHSVGDEGYRDYLFLQSVTNPYKGQTIYTYTPEQRELFSGNCVETFQKVGKRYELANGQTQNLIAYIGTKITIPGLEDAAPTYEYQTTIYYYGQTGTTNWAKKEVMHYNTSNVNDKTQVYLSDQPGFTETTTTIYANRLPVTKKVTITNSTTGLSTSTTTNISYDEFGDVTRVWDTEGHLTESSYVTKARADTGIRFQVLSWTSEKINPAGTGYMEFKKEVYGYDAYGNVTSKIEQELDGSYSSDPTIVNLAQSTRLSTSGNRLNYVLPARTKSVDFKSYYHGIGIGYEVRYWDINSPRPTIYYKKYYFEGDPEYPSGSDSFTLVLPDINKNYQIEVLLTDISNGYLTVDTLSATYYKPIPKTRVTTYYQYAAPDKFGHPSQIHQKYAVGGIAHDAKFGTDSCIVTEYEYSANAVQLPAVNENYTNAFPSKLTEHVTDVDGQVRKVITEVQYNRFGMITRLTKYYADDVNNKLIKEYIYDGLNRLKTETSQDIVNGIAQKKLKKDYTYSPTPDTNGLFSTTIKTSDENGVGVNNHLINYYYNALGQYVEIRKGPLTAALTVEKITYDEFGRKKTVEDGTGVKTTYQYDGFGRTRFVNSIDRNGTRKAYQETIYDDAGRKLTELLHDLTSGSDKITGKTVKQLDKSGNIECVDQYPVIGENTVYTTRYTYNFVNQLTSTTDPRNLTLKYQTGFFGLNLLDYPGAKRNDDRYEYNYQYKDANNTVDKSWQVKKLFAEEIIDNKLTKKYIVTDYDELGRVKRVTYPDNRVMKNYYDFTGRLSRSTLISDTQNTEISYQYDSTGNVKKQSTHMTDKYLR